MSEDLRGGGYGLSAGGVNRDASRMAMIIYGLYAINLAIPGPSALSAWCSLI